MSSNESPPQSSSSSSNDNFDCNICLDIAKDAVVSMCGHLFCWPCLHQWLITKPMRQTCPVCKAAISRDKVIPLYGRGSDNKRDPRQSTTSSTTTPPRPQGQRTEYTNNNNGDGSGLGFGFPFGFGNDNGPGAGGFHMSFGIGAFPFGFFASTFNFSEFNNNNNNANVEDQFLSKIFLWIALLFIIWLLIA